jgi:hypothetical protein
MLAYFVKNSFIKSKLNPIGHIISCLDKTTLRIKGIDLEKFCVQPKANRIMFAGPGDATIATTKKIKPR